MLHYALLFHLHTTLIVYTMNLIRSVVTVLTSHRIPPSQSFFDSTPQWLDDVSNPELIKCRCNAGAIDCSPQADVPDDVIDPLQNHNKGNSHIF